MLDLRQAGQNLLQLQHYDLQLAQMAAEMAAIERGEPWAAAAKRLAACRKEMEALTQKRDELRMRHRQLEGERQALVAERERAVKRLYSGQITNAKEMEKQEQQAAFLAARIDALETDILEAMETVDQLAAPLAELTVRAEKLNQEGQALKMQAKARWRELEVRRQDLEHRRSQAVQAVAEPLRKEYEQLRPRLEGRAVAELVGLSCHGCGLELPKQVVAEARKFERFLRCEHCGRLLVPRDGIQ